MRQVNRHACTRIFVPGGIKASLSVDDVSTLATLKDLGHIGSIATGQRVIKGRTAHAFYAAQHVGAALSIACASIHAISQRDHYARRTCVVKRPVNARSAVNRVVSTLTAKQLVTSYAGVRSAGKHVCEIRTKESLDIAQGVGTDSRAGCDTGSQVCSHPAACRAEYGNIKVAALAVDGVVASAAFKKFGIFGAIGSGQIVGRPASNHHIDVAQNVIAGGARTGACVQVDHDRPGGTGVACNVEVVEIERVSDGSTVQGVVAEPTIKGVAAFSTEETVITIDTK